MFEAAAEAAVAALGEYPASFCLVSSGSSPVSASSSEAVALGEYAAAFLAVLHDAES